MSSTPFVNVVNDVHGGGLFKFREYFEAIVMTNWKLKEGQEFFVQGLKGHMGPIFFFYIPLS
jgi:hypothetical protein